MEVDDFFPNLRDQFVITLNVKGFQHNNPYHIGVECGLYVSKSENFSSTSIVHRDQYYSLLFNATWTTFCVTKQQKTVKKTK